MGISQSTPDRFPAVDGLHVTRLGRGLAFVTLHGGPGLDHSYFRPWLDPLAERVELVYFDLRGQGRSAPPERWDELTHEDWLEDVERVRASLGAREMVLFGHSYGAYLALEYALAHPDHLRGLVLCEGSPVVDYQERQAANAAARGSPEQLRVVGEAFSGPITEDPEVMDRLYRLILPLYFHGGMPPEFEQRAKRMRYSPRAFNQGYFRCLPRYDVRGRLGEVEVPTLVLHGLHDWVTPVDLSAVRLHTGFPASELVVFEESGHFPFVEEQGRFLDVVSEWLERRVIGARSSP